MASEGRRERFTGRAALRKVTTVMRCYDCGRQPIGTAVSFRRTADGIVGFAGLETCGNIWLCPVCNAKVMARRALEIGAALSWASQSGQLVLWGSLTVRHHAGSDLAQLLDMQRSAWRYVVSSRRWRSVSATRQVDHVCVPACAGDCERKRDVILLPRPGRVGYIRAAELTIGSNGWHPHFHPIVFLQGMSRRDAQQLADDLVQLWVEGVELAGGEARAIGGQSIEVLSASDAFSNLAGYVTKAVYSDLPQLALEATWSQGKRSRGRAHSTAPHWSLLADVAAGLMDGVERWAQLEDAISGHRMISWSRGLRQLAGLGVEVEDEAIAAEEVGTADDAVCFLTLEGWAGIRDRPDVLATLLDALEAGWPALELALQLHGVDYFRLVPAEA